MFMKETKIAIYENMVMSRISYCIILVSNNLGNTKTNIDKWQGKWSRLV